MRQGFVVSYWWRILVNRPTCLSSPRSSSIDAFETGHAILQPHTVFVVDRLNEWLLCIDRRAGPACVHRSDKTRTYIFYRSNVMKVRAH